MCSRAVLRIKKMRGDCIGDSEVSTNTSPVFYDITEHMWSSATSEQQEKRQKQRRNNKEH